jgi:hypothetical protein
MGGSFMKKYIMTSSALLVAMLICLTASHATTHMTTTKPGMASQDSPSKGQMAKVVTVDTTKNEVAVTDEKGAQKTMSVGPTTKITKDGKDIALSDIKAGDRVMYELDSASEPPVAKSLSVMSMKSAKP